MSLVRSLPRAALGGYLAVVRWPLDRTANLLGGQSRDGTVLVLDRAEAQIRDVAGIVLFDRALREDAAKRRIAADERGNAARLRAEADRQEQAADRRHAAETVTADRQREHAAHAAADKREAAARKRERDREQAARTAQRLEDEAAKAAAAKIAVAETKAKRERLEQLDQKQEVLADKDDALTARDEAQRLRDAASEAKAERKASSETSNSR